MMGRCMCSGDLEKLDEKTLHCPACGFEYRQKKPGVLYVSNLDRNDQAAAACFSFVAGL